MPARVIVNENRLKGAKAVTGVKRDCVLTCCPLGVTVPGDGNVTLAYYTPPENVYNSYPGKHLIEINSALPLWLCLGFNNSIWHELRHAWQYENGFPRPRLPEGGTFADYEALPHEVDARKWAERWEKLRPQPIRANFTLKRKFFLSLRSWNDKVEFPDSPIFF